MQKAESELTNTPTAATVTRRPVSNVELNPVLVDPSWNVRENTRRRRERDAAGIEPSITVSPETASSEAVKFDAELDGKNPDEMLAVLRKRERDAAAKADLDSRRTRLPGSGGARSKSRQRKTKRGTWTCKVHRLEYCENCPRPGKKDHTGRGRPRKHPQSEPPAHIDVYVDPEFGEYVIALESRRRAFSDVLSEGLDEVGTDAAAQAQISEDALARYRVLYREPGEVGAPPTYGEEKAARLHRWIPWRLNEKILAIIAETGVSYAVVVNMCLERHRAKHVKDAPASPMHFKPAPNIISRSQRRALRLYLSQSPTTSPSDLSVRFDEPRYNLGLGPHG